MGILVKLLGSGVGLASEAIHSARRSRGGPSDSTSASTPQPAVGTPANNGPTEYVELPDEATAEMLIREGKAKRLDENEKKLAKTDGDLESADFDIEDADTAFAADEAAWELDEMAERVATPSHNEFEATAGLINEEDSEEVKITKQEAMVRDIVALAGPPVPRRIPCPVIIPQRRPRSKGRGFVRAYAPVLQECGIPQEAFTKFLKDWYQSSKSDPWIDVVFVAAEIAGWAPVVSVKVIMTVIKVAAGTARELQSRHRRNTFLDRVNEALFMPRGLYAMVMAFKDVVPGQQSGGPLTRLATTLGKTLFAAERLDINQTAAKYSNADHNMSGWQKGLKNIRMTSGRTYGEVELPEAAPLVYPDLDLAAERDLEHDEKGKGLETSGTKEKWKSAGKWVQDYLDRRSQVFYEHDHQGSAVAVPSSSRKPFASRYNDPNHPANSGSLISLLTGGVINPAARRQERRERHAMRREFRNERRIARGYAPLYSVLPARDAMGRRPPGIIKKVLQQDVLYLLIVNLPTEAEVQDSVAKLERVIAENAGGKAI